MSGYIGDDGDLRRRRTGEMELGVTEATQSHQVRRVARPPPASASRLAYEKRRPQWLREMLAEATGVFCYVFPGISATATLTFAIISAGADPSTTNAATSGSLFQVGFAFALGIAFAIIICGPVSGGHFNPAITITFVIYQRFPVLKAIRYIFAQIVGSFVAGLMVYGMYRQQYRSAINEGVSELTLAGTLCAIPLATQSLGYLFFIEFFVDAFIGLLIWAVLDPANLFVAPASAPFTIGLVYAAMVWGFADVTISTNLARDLGTRMVSAIFFTTEAFTYKSYSWISILVNVPATLFAVTYYEFILKDTFQHIEQGHASHPDDPLAVHPYDEEKNYGASSRHVEGSSSSSSGHIIPNGASAVVNNGRYVDHA